MKAGTDRQTGGVFPSDHELMARMQAGGRDALGELYDRYSDRAYHVARTVSRDDSQAEDAVQEGFVAIWNARASYRPQQPSAAAWVLTVVRHRAIDLTRRRATHEARRVNDDALTDHSATEDVAAEAVNRVRASDLKILLARLPDAQREVIVLAFYGQLTHVEIARKLTLPIGTVKGRMRSGLHKLRGEIENVAA